MLHLLSRPSSRHTVPLNIIRRNGRSEIYLGIPRSLTLGQVKAVMRFCAEKSEAYGAQHQGVLAGVFTPQGEHVPRFVVWVSTWQRKEDAILGELVPTLPSLLQAPVIPVIRH